MDVPKVSQTINHGLLAAKIRVYDSSKQGLAEEEKKKRVQNNNRFNILK